MQGRYGWWPHTLGRREVVGTSYSQYKLGQDLNPSKPEGGTTPWEDLDPAFWAPGSRPVSTARPDPLFWLGKLFPCAGVSYPVCSVGMIILPHLPGVVYGPLPLMPMTTSCLWGHCPIFPVKTLGPREAGWPVESHTEGQQ